jgi:hypothetical protein
MPVFANRAKIALFLMSISEFTSRAISSTVIQLPLL